MQIPTNYSKKMRFKAWCSYREMKFFLRFMVRSHGRFIPDPSAKAFNEALGREKLVDAFSP